MLTHYLPRSAARGTTSPLLIYFPDSSLLEEGCVPDRAPLPQHRSLLSQAWFQNQVPGRVQSLLLSFFFFWCLLQLELICSGRTFRDRPLLSAEVTGTFKHHLHHSSRGSFQEDIRHYYHLITFRNPTCLLLFYLPAAFFFFFSSMKSLASDPADQLQPASWDGD